MTILKNIAAHLLSYMRKLIIALFRLYCRLLPASDISITLQLIERGAHCNIDCSKQLSKLLSTPITMLDVGARGGLFPPFDRYAQHIDAILVEPDTSEAIRLRDLGYKVVDKALGASEGKGSLYVLRQSGASSLLPPTGQFMHLYAQGASRYDVVKNIDVEITTISAALSPMVDKLDLLKLDTQGTELDILKGVGSFHPLFIQTEVSMVPIYTGQCLMWDVVSNLWDAGYVPFNFYIGFISPGPRSKFRPSSPLSYRGMPTGGDALLMPDWTRPEGLALIAGREKEFAALCLIYGMENILRYVLECVDLPHKAEILRAL